MRKLMAVVLSVPLMAFMIVPSWGQYNRQYQNRDYGRNSAFYNGAYQAGRHGDYGYDRDGHYRDYDRRHHDDGGIGPGKGALIGGAGGAVLGALFGGGAKGALIGGAAGAGIGAVLGEANKNNERRDRYGRRY